jgi:hypothetical protein
MEWTVLQVKHWLSDLSRIMQEKKEELSRYDQAIGDGDHGVNMARGFKEVEKVLAQEHDRSRYRVVVPNGFPDSVKQSGWGIRPVVRHRFSENGFGLQRKKRVDA